MLQTPNFTGEMVKNLREGMGWKQAQMADYLGMSQANLSKIERGASVTRPIAKLLSTLWLTASSVKQ